MQPRILLTALIILACSQVFALDIYVATSGNDSWTGQLAAPNASKTDGPFASFERARDEIRAARKRGVRETVSVQVRAGAYSVAKTLQLDAQDSGTASAPVTWRAYKSEKPVVLGGKPITGFTPHRGQIVKADTAAQGFKGIYF